MSFAETYRQFACEHGNDADIAQTSRKYVTYEEADVPEFTLPDPLKGVKSGFDWLMHRRPELLKTFSDMMYGQVLPRPDWLTFEELSHKDDALDGTAIRKEVRVHAAMANGRSFSFDLLAYLPKQAAPAPVFVGLNFRGNHTTTLEKDVALTGGRGGISNNFNEESRGLSVELWCPKELVARGYATVTACYHDIFPDSYECWSQSALSLFENLEGFTGTHERYTSIGVWAWGLSRMLDWVETEPLTDGSRAIVHGLSRLGKTALWAGAIDTRFKMVISNCSGCGGAALSRRLLGETPLVMANVFKHWLVKDFRQYIGHEDTLPVDQHELLALVAPRALAVASATDDAWADPRGEFLAAKEASKVYAALFGEKGLTEADFPAPDVNLTAAVSYHIRTGKHTQVLQDYQHYMDIADKYVK